MKRKFTLLAAALMLLSCLAVPLGMRGQTRADELAYTIVFKDNGTGSDGSNTISSIADVISSGSDYVSSISCSNVYNASSGNGIKLGSSSNKGSITLNFNTTGQISATVLKVNIRMYDSGKTVKVYLNGSSSATTLSPGTSFSEYEIAVNTTITSVKIEGTNASKNRFYIKDLKVYEASSGPVQLSAPELVATDGNGEVTLTWGAVTGASSYNIQYADNSSFSNATTVNNATSPKVISGLKNNTTYYFKAMSVSNSTDYISSGYGTAVSATPNNLETITITQDDLSGFTTTYDWYTWTSEGISGQAYAYKSGGIQVNPSKDGGPDCIYNTTPIPGTIKSIKMVKASGTTRIWTVTVGNTTLTSADDGETLAEQEVNTGTTWSIEGDYTNFLLSVINGSTVIESIEIKYEPKTQYAVNVNVDSDYGTITATPTSAIEGTTVSLSATATDNYRFEGFTVVDSDNTPITVQSTGATTGTFTMPASAVTVSGTYTRIYTVNAAGPYTGGTASASPVKAAAGETVELTATATQHYTFESWAVDAGTLSSTTDNPTTLTMPASNVTVTANFTQKTYTITYCVNGNSHAIVPAQVLGGNSIETFPTNPVYGSNSFLGWAQTEGGTDYVTTSYIPTADMTLYAVFGSLGESSLTINPSDVPSSYSSSYASVTVSGKVFKMKQVMEQNSQIQLKNGVGGIYNNESLGGKIKSIVINYASGATKNITVKPCSEAGTTSLDGIEPTPNGDVYTFTFSGNYYYFIMTNGSGATQMASIVINYEAEVPVETTITRISDTQTASSLGENQIIVVENGGVLTFTGTNTNPANIIVEDGGQLITSNAVNATVEKDIKAWNTGSTNGWYFISSPINETLGPDDVTNMLTDENEEEGDRTYDLYRFVATNMVDGESKPWVNYRAHSSEFTINNGMGYLYASENGTTLEFTGAVKPYDADHTISVSAGWNLIGNPYTFNAYPNTAYYTINDANNGITPQTGTTSAVVAPCTGIIVKAANDGTVKFLDEAPVESINNGNVQMVLSQTVTTRGEINSQTLDNAIVSFNEGSQLEKFYFGTQNANLYIPQNNEEYAIVSTEAQGEMPISFRANENGQYTLTVNAEGVEMNYLHLIDNMTGADIDLLQTPSYTFNAKTTDYESRFRLVFAANNEDGASTGSETFSFYSNGNWVISNEGEATLQVIDVTGRILSSETVNGSVSKNIDAPAGMYVLRLINGENVKTQKIVVR